MHKEVAYNSDIQNSSCLCQVFKNADFKADFDLISF